MSLQWSGDLAHGCWSGPGWGAALILKIAGCSARGVIGELWRASHRQRCPAWKWQWSLLTCQNPANSSKALGGGLGHNYALWDPLPFLPPSFSFFHCLPHCLSEYQYPVRFHISLMLSLSVLESHKLSFVSFGPFRRDWKWKWGGKRRAVSDRGEVESQNLWGILEIMWFSPSLSQVGRIKPGAFKLQAHCCKGSCWQHWGQEPGPWSSVFSIQWMPFS